MNIKNLRFLILILAFLLSNTIESQVVIEKTIDKTVEGIYADNFDNFYLLSDNTISKYNSKGQKLFEYSPEGGDKITYLDVKNPFKCLLVFNDQNKVLILDNKLSVMSERNLTEDFDLFGDPLICSSSIGGFWLFDNHKNQLLKLNSDFILEYKRDLNKIKNVISVSEVESNILFLMQSKKIIVYNYASQQQRNFLISFNTNISTSKQGIYFFNSENNTIESYSPENDVLMNGFVLLPEEMDIKNAVLGNQKVFFYDENRVYISSKVKD